MSKITLQTYLNSKLKEKGISLKQAKKNASKYKSISAAKKAGSLYYTNKDGKIMAAVFAEDLVKTPLKRPKNLEKKKTTEKITKKELPLSKEQKMQKIRSADKKSMDKQKFLFETGQVKKVPPKPKIRIHVNTLQNQRDRRAWDKKYGDKYNTDGTLKGSKKTTRRRK
jgi:hypothetical protein